MIMKRGEVMKLDKDISKVTKPELIKILRLCIGKHCDECPDWV